MKGYWIFFLALCLCWDLARSLQCYSCNDPTPSSECSATTNCTEREISCKTIVTSGFQSYPFQGTEKVLRGCADRCEPSNPDQLGSFQLEFCCFSDLCNNRGLYAGGGQHGAGGGEATCGAEEVWKSSSGLIICLISLVAARL